MKTDAVICIALTRTRPSWTPLLRTISWIFGVMLRKSIRAGMLKVRYSVCDSMMTGLPRDQKIGTETTSISFTGGRSQATPAFSPEAARDSGEKIRACGQSLVEQLKIGSRITGSLDAVPRVAHAASAQHRGAGRFDGARSDHVHEDVDLSLGLCPELRPRVPLMGQNVAFAPELIDAEGAAPRHDLRGFCLDKRQVLARDLAVHPRLSTLRVSSTSGVRPITSRMERARGGWRVFKSCSSSRTSTRCSPQVSSRQGKAPSEAGEESEVFLTIAPRTSHETDSSSTTSKRVIRLRFVSRQ